MAMEILSGVVRVMVQEAGIAKMSDPRWGGYAN